MTWACLTSRWLVACCGNTTTFSTCLQGFLTTFYDSYKGSAPLPLAKLSAHTPPASAEVVRGDIAVFVSVSGSRRQRPQQLHGKDTGNKHAMNVD